MAVITGARQILIGSLGGDGRLTFTPVRDTTHLAAWLAQQAAPGTVLVSDTTAQLVQGAVRLEAVPPVSRPGDLNLGTTYQVVGLGPRRARLLKHPTCPLSPFVGRQLELATLWALLRRVEGGQGQADLPFYFPGVAAALGAVYILAGRVANAVPRRSR